MILAIDCGNTNTVFAVFGDDGALRGEWRSATDAKRTADESGLWLIQLLQRADLEPTQIRGAIVASVVPAALFNLKSMCAKYFNRQPVVVGEPGVELGIRNLVDHPEEVGADRLVNAVAAGKTYKGPMIVVDFGTATTFDVIDSDGNYRGGVIAPGVNLSVEALHMAAAKLPRVAVARPERVIGTGTVAAMKSGIYWGYVALIEGLIDRIKKEFGAEMEVIATGGLAPLFTDAVAAIKHADLDLTLRGLYLVYRLNAKRDR